MGETLLNLNTTVNGFVWGPIMLALLVGLGYVMTFWSKGLQFRKLGFVFKRTIGGALKGGSSTKDGNNITPFQGWPQHWHPPSGQVIS